ncbi:cobalt transporter [Leptospira fluminis]|uniref:Cobalt transporter n=1 Tax=Leptospira fluminis TaxID=2484979 RepID=A0A4R9GRN7_9LEPT|nr:CbtA family protein [Leptospira fluminis]TGK20852.1 cobalt transporter [Leptospira fluminis]
MSLLALCKRGFWAGIGAGVLWGILFLFITSPLIWEAELYEDGHSHSHGAVTIHSRSASETDINKNFIHQFVPTVLGCALLGSGFGILSALFLGILSLVRGDSGDIRPDFSFKSVLLFGFLGFAVFHGIPALGTPPELPGNAGAEETFSARRFWWSGSVLCSLLGIFVTSFLVSKVGTVFWKRLPAFAAGILIASFPFFLGIPAQSHDSTAPLKLETRFLYSSLAVNAAFWFGLSAFFLFRKTDKGTSWRFVKS